MSFYANVPPKQERSGLVIKKMNVLGVDGGEDMRTEDAFSKYVTKKRKSAAQAKTDNLAVMGESFESEVEDFTKVTMGYEDDQMGMYDPHPGKPKLRFNYQIGPFMPDGDLSTFLMLKTVDFGNQAAIERHLFDSRIVIENSVNAIMPMSKDGWAHRDVCPINVLVTLDSNRELTSKHHEKIAHVDCSLRCLW